MKPCLSSGTPVLSDQVTTLRDSYVWQYMEVVTLFALSGSLAEGGFEPLTIRSVGRCLITELPLC